MKSIKKPLLISFLAAILITMLVVLFPSSLSRARWIFVHKEKIRSGFVHYKPVRSRPIRPITGHDAGQGKKVLLAYFGTLERSINYTIESHWEHVLRPLLNKGYSVDIAAFHLVPDSGMIDGQNIVDKVSLDYVKPKFYVRENQSDADKVLNTYRTQHCHDERCGFIHKPATVNNAFQQMYSERKLARLIEKVPGNYRFGIVLGPDFYLLNDINIDAIENSLRMSNNAVITSDYHLNDAVSNGLNIAKMSNIKKILSMWKNFAAFEKIKKALSYERFLLHHTMKERLNIIRMPLAYTKIRNNNGYDRTRYLNSDYWGGLDPNIQKEILDSFIAMIDRHPELYYTKWRP